MSDLIRAAGVLCVDHTGHVLLVHRRDGQGWAFPGGHIEDGESPEDAARRELKEETGAVGDEAEDNFQLWTRRVKDNVDFTTFLWKTGKFTPVLEKEHDDYQWVDRHVALDTLTLHPGCRIALLLPDLDEVGIAKAIRHGELVSPQKYRNLWLFALRITGTGASYRLKIQEFVWRDPSIYLNEGFLERCQGLPVILIHPPKNELDGESFRERIVGTIMFAYLLENEVWGIARVYDEPVAKLLSDPNREGPISTSPGVVFRPADEGSQYRLQDGSQILIENKPMLLDHLAIVERGVWDKGGSASGVLNQLHEELTMEPDEKVAPVTDTAAVDAASDGTKLDKVLSHLDSLHGGIKALSTRMDSYEESHKAVASRMDAFEKPKEEPSKEEKSKEEGGSACGEEGKPAPAAVDGECQSGTESSHKSLEQEREGNHLKPNDGVTRTDSQTEIDSLRNQIAELNRRVPQEIPETDRRVFADVQAKAERVAQAFGDSQAPTRLNGETVDQYRQRLLRPYQKHSSNWKDIDLTPFLGKALDPVERQIYADAYEAARHPTEGVEGRLIPYFESDETGRRIRKFSGDPEACWAPFKAESRLVTGIKTKGFDTH